MDGQEKLLDYETIKAAVAGEKWATEKVLVLADGDVAEQGSPSALYAKNGLYTHMANLQTKAQNWTI